MQSILSGQPSAKKSPTGTDRSRLLLLIVVAAAIGDLSYSKEASPKVHRLGSYPRIARLQAATGHQKQCKTAAHGQFRVAGLDSDPSASFASHYNERLKVCFIEYHDIFANGAGQTVVSRSLGDAEGREYADFVSIKNEGRESAASSVVCEIILPSGEELDCHSEQEFNEFIRSYME